MDHHVLLRLLCGGGGNKIINSGETDVFASRPGCFFMGWVGFFATCNSKEMSAEFSKRGGGVHKNFNSPRGGSTPRGGSRGKFPARGSRRGGLSTRGGGDHRDSSSRGRGFGKGGGRGGKGSWSEYGRGSVRSGSNQGRRGSAANSRDGMGFKKRMSFDTDSKFSDGKKSKNKYKKSVSEPSTPATAKLRKYEMDAEQEDEEMSVSGVEDDEIITETSKKTVVVSKQKEKLKAENGTKLMHIVNAEVLPKKSVLKREKSQGREEGLVTMQKKARMTNMESEGDDEEENEDDGNEDESSEDGEDSEQKSVKKNVNGVAKMDESDDDDEESLEDEDEEEEPSEDKPQVVSTPGNAVHVKSALKTPGTGKSHKKVSLSATTTTTPEVVSKNKTPVTPHPQTLPDKKKVIKRLKFEESDESDEDEEEDGEDEDEVGSKLDQSGKMKLENDDSEGEEEEEEDEDEKLIDEDDEESKKDKTKLMADVRVGITKVSELINCCNLQTSSTAIHRKDKFFSVLICIFLPLRRR
uniref:Uncharacterized protein n=1 Tax=Setaria digitata TaxID=48799 RepID=A0A915Q003_9BILA